MFRVAPLKEGDLAADLICEPSLRLLAASMLAYLFKPDPYFFFESFHLLYSWSTSYFLIWLLINSSSIYYYYFSLLTSSSTFFLLSLSQYSYNHEIKALLFAA
jgi:hypothetical protein